MKAEKLTSPDAAFNNNVNNTAQWFQESMALFIETQSKQVQFAIEVYNNAITASFAHFSKGSFGLAFNPYEKMNELFQRNMEILTKLSEENIKAMIEFGTYYNSSSFSKETLEQAMEIYHKQAEAIAVFNQNAYTSLLKQSELSKSFFQPFTENMKEQFDSNMQKYNENIQNIAGTFTGISNPTYDAGKNIFSEMTHQMQNVFNNNMKIWSDFMNKSQAPGFKTEGFDTTPRKPEHKETPNNKGRQTSVAA